MKAFIYDEFVPEDTAMMQALYSRSGASVTEHARKVEETGSGKFMERFYVGYGHASIADCGSTTIFLEGVSMLVAKAVQDWPLYSGQETSSRYIDFSKRPLVDPLKTKESKAVLDRWMKFYTDSQPKVEEHLKKKYPQKPGEDDGMYGKAIKARSFDVLRSFLPAGVTTQLSWHTNLRQAHDHLVLLKYYPLAEVREAAGKIQILLKEKYAHSFGFPEVPEQEAFRKLSMEKQQFFDEKDYAGDFKFRTNIKRSSLASYKKLLDKRPAKTGLPLFLGELGQCTFEFLLDFGSFRDLQRHRNGVCRMPLLTTKYGFNEWYLAELPEDLRNEAKKLINEQKKAIAKLKGSKEDKQYYVAMGFNVTCRVTYALPATVYVTELRSGKLVHPTLRRIAHKMHGALRKAFPELKLNADLEPDEWNVRRGLQDIKEKK